MNRFSFLRGVHVLLLLSLVFFNATSSRGAGIVKWSEEPFDDTVEKVDPEYYGHCLRLISRAMQSNRKFDFPDSSKFSKVPSFRQAVETRQKIAQNEIILGNLRLNSRMAVVLPNYMESLELPERETVDVLYLEKLHAIVIGLHSTSFERKFHPNEFGRAPESNPLGIDFPMSPIITFDHWEYDDGDVGLWGLAIDYPFKKRSEDVYNGVWFVRVESKEKYEELKETIRVLCVFSIGVKGVEQIGRYEFELSGSGFIHELQAEDVEFWVYDGATGEILAKFSAEEMYKGVKKPLGTLKMRKEKKEEKVEEEPQAVSAKEAWNSIMSTAELPKNPRGSRVPDVTIPDDAASLVEALEKCPDGGTILVRQGKNLTLGSSVAKDYPGAKVEKRALVVGETGNPDDVLFVLGENESLWVSGSGANAVFYGIGFEYDAKKKSRGLVKLYRPLASVTDGGKARFVNCAFRGSETPTIPETLALCKGGTARFERCFFTGALENAALVDRDGIGRFDLCEFYGENLVGLTSTSGGKAEATRSILSGNKTGVRVLAGGLLKIETCVFEKNGLAWSIAAGNSDGFVKGEDVVVED